VGPGGAGRRGGGGGGEGAAESGSADDPQALAGAFGGFQQIQELLRPPGSRTAVNLFGGGGGGGFGNQTPLAQPGDYLVTLRVGNDVQRQVLRVEHVRDSSSPFIGELQTEDPRKK